MANSTVCVACSGCSLLMPLCVFVVVCVCEQEAATVAAAEAAPVPQAASGAAPDSEPDEPKDTEMEETVSHHWWCNNYHVVLEIPVHNDLTGYSTLAALILTSLCKWCTRDLQVLMWYLEEYCNQLPCFITNSIFNLLDFLIHFLHLPCGFSMIRSPLNTRRRSRKKRRKRRRRKRKRSITTTIIMMVERGLCRMALWRRKSLCRSVFVISV